MELNYEDSPGSEGHSSLAVNTCALIKPLCSPPASRFTKDSPKGMVLKNFRIQLFHEMPEDVSSWGVAK